MNRAHQVSVPPFQIRHLVLTAWLAIFAFVNSIRIVAYLPQILRAFNDGNGASAISCLTWVLFFASHLTTIMYAVVCLGDLVMAVIFAGNAFACLVIVTVTLFKRRAHSRKKIHANDAEGARDGSAG